MFTPGEPVAAKGVRGPKHRQHRYKGAETVLLTFTVPDGETPGTYILVAESTKLNSQDKLAFHVYVEWFVTGAVKGVIMANENDYQSVMDRIAALREAVTNRFAGDLVGNPALADALKQQVDDVLAAVVQQDMKAPLPPDKGLAQLIGVGPDAAREFGKTRIPQGVEPYDEQITSERLVAVADLYYIYQHEKIGVFRVDSKAQGVVPRAARCGCRVARARFCSTSSIAATCCDIRSTIACRRIGAAFGYGNVPVPQGTTPNVDFHNQFGHFINQVALFWRDKRISDVVRERAYDPSFGSIAIVRRAGLDLRNNLKFTSFGHLNVLRVEVMQLLEEAFKILGADDVKNLFGTDNAWDTVEEILVRYLQRAACHLAASADGRVRTRGPPLVVAPAHHENATRPVRGVAARDC